jgi:hypothetical protein
MKKPFTVKSPNLKIRETANWLKNIYENENSGTALVGSFHFRVFNFREHTISFLHITN